MKYPLIKTALLMSLGIALPFIARAELPSDAESIKNGKTVFNQSCSACHQPSGEGIPSAFPPLAKSDFLLKDKTRAIAVIINGLQGKVTVNGKPFNGAMPALGLKDEQIANVLSYVLNTWGNNDGTVTPQDVAAVRASGVKPKVD